MSLHAQLSPEAIARLHAQKRNSTISSLVIALLVLVLLGLVLGLFLLPAIKKEDAVLVSYSYERAEEKPEKKVPKETVQKKPSSPSASVAKVITSAAVSQIAIPVPDVEVTTPSLDFGTSDDFGSGWGSGSGGNGFQSIPSTMRKRCSEKDRLKRLKEMGGTVKGEKAVVKALDWLQETQNDDGSWTGETGQPYPVAMTGMAILAYLGHCETPKSPKYGETVEKGIVYLINQGMKDGPKNLLCSPGVTNHATAYEHGIAAYALAESYTFCNELRYDIPNLKEVTKKVGERILEGQTNSGGYLYGLPNGGSGGDNSVGYWQLQALKACKHTGIWPESKFKKDIKEAMKWFENVQGQNGAVGYRNDAGRSPGLTGGALLCMQFWGEGDSKMAKDAADYIRENTKFGDSFNAKDSNLYYHYYNAQAMINVGGKDWDWYNDLVRDKIIDAQEKDGSWKQKMGHGPVNNHMATCLATMLLEVYYRFLPGTKSK